MTDRPKSDYAAVHAGVWGVPGLVMCLFSGLAMLAGNWGGLPIFLTGVVCIGLGVFIYRVTD